MQELRDACLARAVLLVDVLKILLVATECGLLLVHLLVQLGQLMKHNVLMVSAGHGPAVALGGRIVQLQVVVRVALSHCDLPAEQP